MIYQPPMPLPGEHAASIMYRYFQMTRFTKFETMMKLEYNSKLDSPRRLWQPTFSMLAESFSSKYSLARFIEKYTNITDYSLFLDESVFKDSSVESMLNKLSGFKFHNALNVSQDVSWRYCPMCAREDDEKFGTTYFHVAHQCFYKRVCRKHNVLLEKSDPYHFSLPPLGAESVTASQSDLKTEAVLSSWVDALKEIPQEERKIRALNLIHQKICIFSYDRKNPYHVQRVQYAQNRLAKRFNRSHFIPYFEWGALASGLYPLNSVIGLMGFLDLEKHFHPMIYLMLIDLFLKQDELDLSMQYSLASSNVKERVPQVVSPIEITDLINDNAA